jgi:hypothetical protein
MAWDGTHDRCWERGVSDALGATRYREGGRPDHSSSRIRCSSSCARLGLRVPRSGYFTNDLGSREIVLRRSERGNTGSGLATRDLIEDYRPEVVVVIGIAGGISGRDNVQPGDVVVPDYLHYADFRSLRKEGDLARHAPHDAPTLSLHETCVFPASLDHSWMTGIASDPPVPRTAPRVLVGSLIAGEKVYGDPDHEEQRRLGNHQHTQLWHRLDAKNPALGFGVFVANEWFWYET